MGQCLSSFNNPSVHNKEIDVNKDLVEWTVDDVYNWLLSVNIADNNLHSNKFKRNNINGLGLKGIDIQYLINKLGISANDADLIISKRDALLNPEVHTEPDMQSSGTNSSLDIHMTSLNDDTCSKPKPPKITVTDHNNNPVTALPPTPSPKPMKINKHLTNEHIQQQQKPQQQRPLDPTLLSELVQIGVIGLSGSVLSVATSAYDQIGNPSPKRTRGTPPGTPGNNGQRVGNRKYGKPLTPAQSVNAQTNDNAITLNRNAHPFFPQQQQIPNLQRHHSAPIHPLSAIDETKAVDLYKMMQNECKKEEKKETIEYKSCDNDKNKKGRKKGNNQWKKFGSKGNIKISRHLTETIIPNTIRENIPNLFEYMDKSTMIQRKDQYKDDKIRIFNYDFHNKYQVALYCVAQKQVGSKNGHYKWKMDEKLYTAKDIVNQFGNVDIPASSRQKPSFLNELNFKQKIENAIKQHQTNHIISKKTKWAKISINTNMDNKQRFILAIDNTEFIKKVTEYIKDNNTVNILPILVFNHNEHHVEYIHIVRIAVNVDIGISYKYEKDQVKVREIYLKREDILGRHMLVSPHDCHCLDNFTTNIDMIEIGNVDCQMNQIKDLKKRLNVTNDRLNDANDTISKLNVEIEKLKNENNRENLLSIGGGLNSSSSISDGSTGSNTPNSSKSSGSDSAESNNQK